MDCSHVPLLGSLKNFLSWTAVNLKESSFMKRAVFMFFFGGKPLSSPACVNKPDHLI